VLGDVTVEGGAADVEGGGHLLDGLFGGQSAARTSGQVKVNYLDLTDYLAIAAEVTGLDLVTLSRVTNLDLADSALHAPRAGWAGEDFYPDFIDKAAVLVVRLAKNHPLPDGNKRAAWVALVASRSVTATAPGAGRAGQAQERNAKYGLMALDGSERPGTY